jgi:hypothetical protein
MSYFIVEQLVKVGQGENSELVPVPVKTIGNAPNLDGKANADGDVMPFIRIPPIIRLYIGSTVWKSPTVMPTAADLDGMDVKPIVWTLTLNPRTGNINWHHGLGMGTRGDIDPRSGFVKVEKLKPVSGTADTMAEKLGNAIGSDLAEMAIGLMLDELDTLQAAQAAAKAKREAKADGKPQTPRKPVRKPSKAEVKAAADDARMLEWLARRAG